MELYEIVYWKTFCYNDLICRTTADPLVITATMDRSVAEKMLEIYKYNQDCSRFCWCCIGAQRLYQRDLPPDKHHHTGTAYVWSDGGCC